MFAYQWERCNAVVKTGIPPAFCIMASCTVCAEATTMVIIVGMAGIAICRRALVDTVGMTRGTGQVIVSRGQRESCVVMVEARPTPATGGMAGIAILPELANVRVLVSVTGKAI